MTSTINTQHSRQSDDEMPPVDLTRSQGWLKPSQFSAYLFENCAKMSPLKGSSILNRLKQFSSFENLSSSQLHAAFTAELTIETLKTANYRSRDLTLISPLTFLQHGENYLPLAAFPPAFTANDVPDGGRILFLNASLPSRKLSKFQFIH